MDSHMMDADGEDDFEWEYEYHEKETEVRIFSAFSWHIWFLLSIPDEDTTPRMLEPTLTP